MSTNLNSPLSGATAGGPLAGTTVVTFEQAVAAPFATRQLADLGARVIKIERAEGDFARGYDRSMGGESSYFVWLNRGKESVVLDLKSAAGLEAAEELVRRADVLVQNLAPGAIERLGLGAPACAEMNPRLVHASLSGYGRGGPYEQKKAYDLLVQCEAGLLSVTGDEHPARVGISIADIAAGMYLYTGVLTALLQRATTGSGSVFEVSMLEALGEWMAQPMYYAIGTGTPAARAGARHATIAPYGPFDARDGVVFLSIQNEREWVILCDQVLGQPDLASEPRFSANPERVAHRDELEDIINAAFGQRDVADVIAALDSSGIANAQLRDMNQFAEHPQLVARERWRTVGSPGGSIPALLPPVTVAGQAPIMGDVPALGEHTDAVLSELGLAGP